MIMAAMNTIATVPQGLARLGEWGLIRAQGAEAAKFLHTQLTQDIEHLPADQARLAGWCSAKGRLLATFVAWRPQAETVWLACSADLLAPTLKRLSMFVLRAKCRLSDASAEVALYGLAGACAREWLGAAGDAAPWGVTALPAHDQAWAIRLPDAAGQPRWLLAQPAALAAPPLPELPEAAWRWLEVRSGVARVVAATAEQFVPQMVNLELVGGVNFQKGCYPGQEVVARSQYRGTLKRRTRLYSAATALAPGQEVFDPTDPDQPAGQVVLAAPDPDASGRFSALVEVKLAAADGALWLQPDAPEASLQADALPYSLTAPA